MERACVCVCVSSEAVCGTSGWNGTISSMLLSVMKDVMFSLLSFPSSGHTKSALPSSNWQTRKVSRSLLRDAAPPASHHRVAAEPPHWYLFEEHHSVALDFILLEDLWTGGHGELLLHLDQINVSEDFGLLALGILTQTERRCCLRTTTQLKTSFP